MGAVGAGDTGDADAGGTYEATKEEIDHAWNAADAALVAAKEEEGHNDERYGENHS